MVKIQNKIITKSVQNTAVQLKQLNTNSFEMTQIQKYAQQSFDDVSNNVNQLASRYLLISNTKDIPFGLSSSVQSAYLKLNDVQLGEDSLYNIQSGEFVSPIEGIVYINFMFYMEIASGSSMLIYYQKNKSNISPLNALPTNVENVMQYAVANSGNLLLTGIFPVNCKKGDKLKVVYSSDDFNGNFIFTAPYKSYLNFRW